MRLEIFGRRWGGGRYIRKGLGRMVYGKGIDS